MVSAPFRVGILMLSFVSMLSPGSCGSMEPECDNLQVSFLQSGWQLNVSNRTGSEHSTGMSLADVTKVPLWPKCVLLCVAASLCIMVLASMAVPAHVPASRVGDGKQDAEHYRPDIDGLRAVAVTAVVIFHWKASWLAGGWVGVDIFYVISGYVVTCALIRRRSLCNRDGLITFYASRVRRLMPNSLCTISVTSLLVCLFVPKWPLGWKDPLAKIYRSGVYATFSAANIYFGSSHKSYWDTGSDSLEMNPYTHMWSLGVEEQFYLLYPMLLILLHGQAPTIEFLKASPQRSRTALGFCVLISFMAYWSKSSTNPEASFFYLHFRFWELAIGGWLYELQASYGDERWAEITAIKVLQIPCEFLGIAFIGAAIFMPSMEELTDLTRMCLATSGAVCCILANTAHDGGLRRILSSKCVAGIGKMSYSIYLWHWPVFTVFRWTFGMDSIQCLTSSLVLTGVFAFAAYHVIEKPIRQWPGPAWKVFAALVAGVIVCQGLLVAVSHSELTAVPPICQSVNKPIKNHSTPITSRGRPVGPCACMLHTAVQHVPPSAVAYGSNSGDTPRCFPAQTDLKTVTTPKRTILIVGDSHAQHVPLTFQAIRAVRNLYTIKLMYMSCFGLMDNVNELHGEEKELNRKARKYCKKHSEWTFSPDDFRENVFKEVNMLQKNDIVVFAQSANQFYRNLTRKLIHAAVHQRNASFVVLGDNPRLNGDMTECVPTWTRPNAARGCETSVTWQRSYQASYAWFAKNLTTMFPSTYYFERWPLYCHGETCDGIIPGTCTVAYIDSHHLSPEGSIYSSPFMCSFMAERGLL